MLPKVTGVYQIKNLANGKRYIGSSASQKGVGGRWIIHKSLLNRNIHPNKKLQNAWNKYGEDSFVCEILEVCDRSQCLNREQYYLNARLAGEKFVELGYNISRSAHSTLGYQHSDLSKAKMSKNRRGIQHKKKTRELFSQQRRGDQNGNSKLSWDQVNLIRTMIEDGMRQVDIAVIFGVQRQAIWKIAHNLTWHKR